MEMKSPVAKIPVERFDEEDSFGILGRNLLDRLRINKPKSNRFKWILGFAAQKLLHRPKLAGLGKTPYRMILIPNYNPMGLPRLPIGHLTPYA
jgi:hypothetical protein